ncbi:hypothetical protein [Clostridium beijerinckii]|uniref:Uncharacterized protein n=1 Tax=Clostridium beijerinckii TaxID=1520 RepID=A0AAX0AZV4_CLOBE|nr:hypothetical protein [Clostridium beijerinckii]MBA8935887.1 hypothetical protein [Clostridium beijerinckii]NRT32661.1 hypothetical protein [Clostridium beijerinckii]NRT47911.1 hypothetical protein [Clostridium beijerinckii]NRT88519.1 hypothetical protein [Clostridium beijerinckii]NRU35959.1 hypothetical protein [Clostridium beijerinckii]
MIKALLTILVKLVEAKLEKIGIEQAIIKNQNYITVAKQIWNEIDETFRISTSIEEKLQSKTDLFESKVLAKFPELKKEDIDSLRLAIGGEVNQGKQVVLDNSIIIKQLTDENNNLKAKNNELENKIASIQSTVAINVAQ